MSAAMNYSRTRITEEKQAELTRLTDAVLVKGFEVNELSSVVASLEAKAAEFANFLATATTAKETALDNLNQIEQTKRQILLLNRNAGTMSTQAKKAQNSVNTTASSVSKLLDQLIFVSEMLDKLSLTVTKKKALVALIPTELLTVLNKATQDAANAFAATITALEACYAATASADEVANITALGSQQANDLLKFLTNSEMPPKKLAQIESAAGQALSEVTNTTNSLDAVQTAVTALQAAFEARTTAVNAREVAVEGQAIAQDKLVPLAAKEQVAADRLSGFEKESAEAETLLATLKAQAEHDDSPALADEISELEQLLVRLAALIAAAAERQKECQAEVDSATIELDKAKANLVDKDQALTAANNKVAAERGAVATARSNLLLGDRELDETLQAITASSHTPIIDTLRADYEEAVEHYEKTLAASKQVTLQLDQAQHALEIAEENLASLQAGLSAATAAALAA